MESVSGCAGFDCVIEEGDSVIGDIVVQPGEEGAGFICERGEGRG